jgi:pimeloyl-ACP methyl ester carboxylesterase
MLRRVLLFSIILLAALAATASAQFPTAGRWEGAITIMGQALGISVEITGAAAAPKATIDIPQQGAKGLSLVNVRINDQLVHFELPAGPGIAVFDGVLSGEAIAGTFTQGGMKGTFELKKAAPALPDTPPPYKEEAVQIVNGGITLAGTLTLPPTAGPYPAVILITGSGAQNRDEEVFGFKVFKLLADRLTRAGLAVLRCDDRGVGGSTGSTTASTTADFAEDTLAQVKYLKGRADVDRSRIGLLGHSEGGIVAPLAATRATDIAFIVLLSGPALTGEKVMLAQAEVVGRAEGRTPEQVKSNARVQQVLFAAARQNRGWEDATLAVRAELRTAIGQLPEEQRKAIPDVERMISAQADSQIAFARSQWFRYFLDYDPAPTLARVTCPVLAIFGERDLQVPVESNRAVMQEIAKKAATPRFTIEVIPTANHLYQASTTGSITEYAKLKKEFAPGFVETLLAWLAPYLSR